MPVIPVLVSSARMRKVAELPPSLQPLALRHGMQVRPEPDFNGDMAKLIAGLERLEERLASRQGGYRTGDSAIMPSPLGQSGQFRRPATGRYRDDDSRRRRYDDDDIDRRSAGFPSIVRLAAIAWIVFGGLILLFGSASMLIQFAQAANAPPGAQIGGAVCGMALILLFGLGFIIVGIQTINGTAADTIGNGIGSLVFGLINLVGGVFLLGAFGFPLGCNS